MTKTVSTSKKTVNSVRLNFAVKLWLIIVAAAARELSLYE